MTAYQLQEKKRRFRYISIGLGFASFALCFPALLISGLVYTL